MLPLSLLVFFTSGFAALLYQITWQRLLAIFSGADVYSAAIVIASFMAGLGWGSLAGGHVADRVSPPTSLLLFMGAETGIALFGFQSQSILYDLLYQRLGHLAQSPATAAAVLFVVLLWPTSLMGASLPLLARAVTRKVEAAAGTIGWLYAGNTLGAAIGALAATWWFLPLEGLGGTATVAARLNLACAIAAIPVLAIAFLRRSVGLDPATRASTEESRAPVIKSRLTAARFPFRTWAALYALSGFLALSLEITWFRVLGVMLKSTSFTFGTLLAQYLFWLGLGSAIGSVMARRLHQPAVWFLALQCAATVYAGVSLALLVWQAPSAPALARFHDYLGRYEPLEMALAVAQIRDFLNDLSWHGAAIETLPQGFLALYFVVPAVLIGPATLLMGFSFPALQRVVQTELSHLGRRVGTLLVCNIIGSTLGTIVTSWLLLAWLGTAGTLKALIVLSAAFALLAAGSHVRGVTARRLRTAALVATLAVVVLIMPAKTELWARLHGTRAERIIVREDGSGVSVLKAAGEYFSQGVWVFVNGLGQSNIPYGGIHTILGALPALIHPDPRDIAIIGLGSGDTLYAAAARGERIVSIEIVKPQFDALAALARLRPDPALTTVLHDRRIRHVFGDGRRFIKHSGRTFDIIEADALRPGSAYAGNLYSDAYFHLLLDHLKPHGLAVTWSPTERVERTFIAVFPHVMMFDAVLIGSNEPIVPDMEAIQRRLDDQEYQQYFWRAGVDIRQLLQPAVARSRIQSSERKALSDLNTDLFPRDELGIPKIFDLSMRNPEGSR